MSQKLDCSLTDCESRPHGPFEWGPQRLLILWRDELAKLILRVVKRHGGEMRRRELTRAVIAAIRPRPRAEHLPRCRVAIGQVLKRLLEADELVWIGQGGHALRGQVPTGGERLHAVRLSEA